MQNRALKIECVNKPLILRSRHYRQMLKLKLNGLCFPPHTSIDYISHLSAYFSTGIDVYRGSSFSTIDIESLQNRLLKVCYVPTTSAGPPRVSFFFSFLFWLLRPLTTLMKQTRQAVHAVKQSIFLDVYV